VVRRAAVRYDAATVSISKRAQARFCLCAAPEQAAAHPHWRGDLLWF